MNGEFIKEGRTAYTTSRAFVVEGKKKNRIFYCSPILITKNLK